MAKIVLGIGASHSPMINSTLEEWVAMTPREAGMKILDREGRPSSYEALVEEAAGRYDADLHPEVLTQRYQAVQNSLDTLASIIKNAKLDALVVIGDDQRELFLDDNLPAMLIYHGDHIPNDSSRI